MQDPRETGKEDNDSLSEFERELNEALEQSTEAPAEDQEQG